MVDGMLKLVPMARVGHIGVYRDHETLEPVEYYCKLPQDICDRDVVLLDPMLATAGSACDAIKIVKERGAKNIKFVCLIAAKSGVERLHQEHPDVDIYCAAVDEVLNEKGHSTWTRRRRRQTIWDEVNNLFGGFRMRPSWMNIS